MPDELEPGNLVFGVFGFLDAILTSEQQERATTGDLSGEDEPAAFFTNKGKLAHTINQHFRLQFWGCPLRKELAAFRLFHRDDMANALACAYRLYKRGENPTEALLADYVVPPHGFLSWEDIDSLKEEAKQEKLFAPWRHFYRFLRTVIAW